MNGAEKQTLQSDRHGDISPTLEICLAMGRFSSFLSTMSFTLLVSFQAVESFPAPSVEMGQYVSYHTICHCQKKENI